MTNGDDWLLLEEVAEISRTSTNTVRHWIRTGRLLSTRPGRRRLVRRSHLDEFLSPAGSTRTPLGETDGDSERRS